RARRGARVRERQGPRRRAGGPSPVWRRVRTLAVLPQGGPPPDVVLLLGARLGLFPGGQGGGFLARTPRLIQVDIEGAEIGRNRDGALGIVADCREARPALEAAAGERRWPDRTAWPGAAREPR